MIRMKLVSKRASFPVALLHALLITFLAINMMVMYRA